METTKKGSGQTIKPVEADFARRLWEESWAYIKTVVEVVREPILILDKDLRVMAANESFYRTFQVEPYDIEKKIVYEFGNGEWNIPSLRKLLEDILSKNTFSKGFQIAHEFPSIGRKVMILNARQINFKEDSTLGLFPSIILLAVEDVTEMTGMMVIAETLAGRSNQFEARLAERTRELEMHIAKLKKEINELKKKP